MNVKLLKQMLCMALCAVLALGILTACGCIETKPGDTVACAALSGEAGKS